MTDLDFADDIQQAQELLSNVENAALRVDLRMNAKKNQFMVYNQPTRDEIHTVYSSCLEEVKDFKYLGSWVQRTEH